MPQPLCGTTQSIYQILSVLMRTHFFHRENEEKEKERERREKEAQEAEQRKQEEERYTACY